MYFVGTHKQRFVRSVPQKLECGWRTTQECSSMTAIWSTLAGRSMTGSVKPVSCLCKCVFMPKFFIVVWPTMSCFTDWLKCRHVTLIIIEWCRVIIMINGHVTVYRYLLWNMVTWCSLNANIRYNLRCLCLRDNVFIVSILIKYSLNLLISAILQ